MEKIKKLMLLVLCQCTLKWTLNCLMIHN